MHHPKESYYEHTRLDLVTMLEGVPQTALEVGCGTGNTLRYLKEHGIRETFGIEVNGAVAEHARKQVDNLAVGDIETMEWPFGDRVFDCIILGDVLEHLRDPWGTVEMLFALLSQGGQIVASLPNVRFYGVSIPLLFGGRWTYTEEGILDRTHLRFFTKRTAVELFSACGFVVRRVSSTYGPRRQLLNRLTMGVFRDLLARQHLIHAYKPIDRGTHKLEVS